MKERSDIDFLMNFGTLVASHKFETEPTQRKWNLKNFIFFFVSFSNLDALMKVYKPKRLMLENISTNKIILLRPYNFDSDSYRLRLCYFAEPTSAGVVEYSNCTSTEE